MVDKGMERAERLVRLAKEGGWIAVDLDGTILTYDNWVAWDVFGEPIAPMVERIRGWLAEGIEVRVFTARVGLPALIEGALAPSTVRRSRCRTSGVDFSDHMMVTAIQDKLESIGLPRLKVQCYKDVDMIELWDDRAIQVVANTGRALEDEVRAEFEAQRGKQFGAPSLQEPPTPEVEIQNPQCGCYGPALLTSLETSSAFAMFLSRHGVCAKAWQTAFEDAIVSMATGLAIGNTIIEPGSIEANRETERVLVGLEGRLFARLYRAQRAMARVGVDGVMEQMTQILGTRPRER